MLDAPVAPPLPPAQRPSEQLQPVRVARPRSYVLCRPTHFDVEYAINPWMDPTLAVDRDLALRQWQGLVDAYRSLGHEVRVVEGVEGLPDMVFVADSGLVVDGVGVGARYLSPMRQAEAPAVQAWLREQGVVDLHMPTFVNEGEGDFLVVGDLVLAGTGFRTDLAAHHEAQEHLGLPVVSLQLVDARTYHLNTALGVLDDRTVAYYPPAFSDGSRRALERLFPDALIATAEDVSWLGLNLVSDGRNVVLPSQATRLADELRLRGYTPVPVDLSELRKSGGSAKCCTLELHRSTR